VYNIQKAVSRLDFAPKLKEIQITDIQKGIGAFTPKPDKEVSFAALKETLKKAGYVMNTATITIRGTLAKNDQAWTIIAESSKQRFFLLGPTVEQEASKVSPSAVEISGDWRTVGEGASAHEEIKLGSLRKVPVGSSTKIDWATRDRSLVMFIPARFEPTSGDFFSGVIDNSVNATQPTAPIRVTSPGLTVYKGGAFTPRLYLIRQHLGAMNVDRQILDMSVSYTPKPRMQLEVEVPFSRTAFDNKVTSGSEVGLGNVTLWSKYRFFRKVKTYGDRQAAIRFGLELPTGNSSAPSQINVPAFVRQQLTPINGGAAAHFDLAFSQAGGRLIFGGNAEGIVRSDRAGFRMGQEIRLETDTEYVLLPRKYKAPGHELFAILETTFIHRATGQLNGNAVAGSKSTEYYLAPGLQYAAAPQFVIEGSFQFPVVRNTGALALRNDRNLLLGVKYLF
jgi:hypothetical protein